MFISFLLSLLYKSELLCLSVRGSYLSCFFLGNIVVVVAAFVVVFWAIFFIQEVFEISFLSLLLLCSADLPVCFSF